jgi:RHS repeat-associated protein
LDIEGGIYTWSYEGRGLVSRQDYPNTAWMTATYDGDGRTLQMRHAYLAGGVTPTELTLVGTAYDAVGNVVNQNRPDRATYTYDSANQLVSESHMTRGLTTWTYDTLGNRLTAFSSGDQTATTWSYDGADQMVNEAKSLPYGGPTAPWFTSATFSYDATGNRTLEQMGQRSDAGWTNTTTTYGWDPANRLLTVTHTFGAGTDQADSYRPDGLRAAKVEGASTQKMIWDRSHLLAQVDGSGNVVNFYSRGATLAKRRNPTGATYVQEYLHLDRQGTVALRSQNDGTATTGVLDPDPWGGHASDTSALGWLGDPGYFGEAGLARPLYYVRARWYVAGGPGWLSQDPLGLGGRDVNLYRYVQNRPVSMADPTGLASSSGQCGQKRGGPDINEFWRCFWDLMNPSHDWNPMAPNACRSCKAWTGVHVDCDSRFFFWAWPVHRGPLQPPRPPRGRWSSGPTIVIIPMPPPPDQCNGVLVGAHCGGMFAVDPTKCQDCVQIACTTFCRGLLPEYERNCLTVGKGVCLGGIIPRANQ